MLSMNRKQRRAAAKLGDGAISATRDLLAAGQLDEAERSQRDSSHWGRWLI